MFYDFQIEIKAGKTKEAPAEQIVNLVSGIVHRVEIEFRAGCRHTVFVAIYKGAHQVWPTNIEGAFNAENFTIMIDEGEKLPAGPNQFRIVGWSPLAQYDHIITVRFGILPPETLTPFAGIGGMLKKFLKLVGVK